MSAVVAAAEPTPMHAPTPSVADVVTGSFSKWTLGVPYPLLFVAGAAVGILFASLIVLCTHGGRIPASTASNLAVPAAVAPVATWQANVITIHPAAQPDPMFDAPMVVEPPSMAPAPIHHEAKVAKKPVAKSPVRRHAAAAGKQAHAATSDMLNAAL